MSWKYSDLSHEAKQLGGPDALRNHYQEDGEHSGLVKGVLLLAIATGLVYGGVQLGKTGFSMVRASVNERKRRKNLADQAQKEEIEGEEA